MEEACTRTFLKVLFPTGNKTENKRKPPKCLLLINWINKFLFDHIMEHTTVTMNKLQLLNQKDEFQPWLVWLSGLSAGLQNKGSLVRFPVRAHAWVAGQVPSGGRTRGNHTLMFLSLFFSLPSPPSKNK